MGTYKINKTEKKFLIKNNKNEKKLTAACWYLGDGETPGAIAHSQRPSLCFARPYALDRGCRFCKTHIKIKLVLNTKSMKL